MIDREKVITGLELCTNISPDGCLMLCPYKDEKDETYSGFCEQVLKQDALALLKEQEAVEPIYNEEKYGDHLPHCGRCEKVLPNNAVYGKVNFCHHCGRKVKWND